MFSQLGFDGFVEELDVVLDAEIVEEVFRQRELHAHVWPADREFEGHEAVSAAAGDSDLTARHGVGVGIERDRLFGKRQLVRRRGVH